MTDPYYVMKMMARWVTLYELEGAKTRRDFTGRGFTKKKNYLPTDSFLGYILSIDIKYINKTTGVMHKFLLRGNR